MFDRLPRTRRLIASELALVLFGAASCPATLKCVQINQARVASANEDFAKQLGLTSPHSLRPVPNTYRTKAEGVFADGTVFISRATAKIGPTVRVAWSHPGGSLIKPEPFPLDLVSVGSADESSRRTIIFDFRYNDKALPQLFADIAGSNNAVRDEALARLQYYCSRVRLGLRPGEKEAITRFL